MRSLYRLRIRMSLSSSSISDRCLGSTTGVCASSDSARVAPMILPISRYGSHMNATVMMIMPAAMKNA